MSTFQHHGDSYFDSHEDDSTGAPALVLLCRDPNQRKITAEVIWSHDVEHKVKADGKQRTKVKDNKPSTSSSKSAHHKVPNSNQRFFFVS